VADLDVTAAPCRYVPLGHLDGARHVVVDGAARSGTQYTLSHWPASPTPGGVRDDLSAGIVVLAREHPERLPAVADVATLDHYDVDGVIALALMVDDGLAASHSPVLVEAARVGDFGVVRDQRAALVAFALERIGAEAASAMADACRSPVGAASEAAWTAAAVARALAVLPALAADPERYRILWGPEAAACEAAHRALAEGWAVIEEVPAHDLAVVRVDTTHPDASSAAWGGAPLHRAAVYSATDHLRVATLAGPRYEVRYRYESWVRLASCRPRPRVDLGPAASALTAAETDGARWVFDGAGALTGALHLAGAGPSTLQPAHFLDVVAQRLEVADSGPAAWDPYAPTGPVS
jgi:hypothetical protein